MRKTMHHKKMRFPVVCFLILSMISICLPPLVSAGDNWINQARLNVSDPGMVETVLPPGLHFQTGSGDTNTEIELELLGPDGKPRSFELYFRENQGPGQVVLKSGKVELHKDLGYFWEGMAPENFIAERLQVEMADNKFVGKVDVEALYNDQWTWLKKNAALFKVGGYRHADIDITPLQYKGFRLYFTGYDVKYGKTPLPVRRVTLFGRYIRKNYAEITVSPAYRDAVTGDYTEIKSVLPGSGLWIKNIQLETDAQFQGAWQLGKESVVYGERQFVDLIKGVKSTVNRNGRIFNIDVNRKWQDRSLVLRLYTEGRHIGRIASLKAECRLPRLVFLADKAGTYTARAGAGNAVRILETPGDADRRIDHELTFSAVERNNRFRPESLVEKYNIKGGPFSPEGYTWTSRVNIPEPGYYKLVLSLPAALEPNQAGIRLVKDDLQVPYFRGTGHQKSITPEVTMDYDKEKNITTWTVDLPQASPHWTSIRLEAEGIFDRMVVFQKQGHTGTRWEDWAAYHWKSHQNKVSHLGIPMDGFPQDQTRMRIVMDHKDNSPLTLKQIQAFYMAPTLHFIVSEAGTYQLTGGNQEARRPSYDLALVQSRLLESEPVTANMSEIAGFKSSEWKSRLNRIFSDQGWGLYAVLGLVTLVLIILIAGLFPKTREN